MSSSYYRFVQYPEVLTHDRPCHAKNTGLVYTEDDEDWNAEQLERTAAFLSQHHGNGAWFTVVDAQRTLQKSGIEYVNRIMATRDSTARAPLKRTLHLFQTMQTRMTHLLSQLVALGAVQVKDRT
jgi:hypothetical protein